MDFDKLSAFITKVGIVPAMLGWLAYEFHNYVAQQMTFNQQIVKLLEQHMGLVR